MMRALLQILALAEAKGGFVAVKDCDGHFRQGTIGRSTWYDAIGHIS